MNKIPKVAVFVRIRPATKDLLDKACETQQRSRSYLVDKILKDNLKRDYSDINARLDMVNIK